jgi:hypothetical protein
VASLPARTQSSSPTASPAAPSLTTSPTRQDFTRPNYSRPAYRKRVNLKPLHPRPALFRPSATGRAALLAGSRPVRMWDRTTLWERRPMKEQTEQVPRQLGPNITEES